MSNLSEIMAEVADKLRTVDSLNVYDSPPKSVNLPAAFPTLPETVDRTLAYNHGKDMFVLDAVVVVGTTTNLDQMEAARYADEDGPDSVSTALESGNGNTYQSCKEVTVTRISFLGVDVAGTECVAVLFRLEIDGD